MDFYKDITKYIAHHFINIRHQNRINFLKANKNSLYFEYKHIINQIKIVNYEEPNINILMLQDYIDILKNYKDRHIRQYLFFIGKKPYTQKHSIIRNEIMYVYNLININNFKKSDFIDCYDISRVLLSILFAENESDIKTIITKIYELSFDDSDFMQNLNKLLLLSKYNNLDKYITFWINLLQNSRFKELMFKR